MADTYTVIPLLLPLLAVALGVGTYGIIGAVRTTSGRKRLGLTRAGRGQWVGALEGRKFVLRRSRGRWHLTLGRSEAPLSWRQVATGDPELDAGRRVRGNRASALRLLDPQTRKLLLDMVHHAGLSWIEVGEDAVTLAFPQLSTVVAEYVETFASMAGWEATLWERAPDEYHPGVQMRAFEALAEQVTTSEDQRRLSALLQSASAKTRLSCSHALGEADRRWHLRRLCRDDDPEIRRAALERLERIGGPDDLDTFHHALEDADVGVLSAAVKGLAVLRAAHLGATLVRHLTQARPDAEKVPLIRGLAYDVVPEAEPWLLDAVRTHEDSALLTAALETLRDIGSKDALDALRRLKFTGSARLEPLRREAIERLWQRHVDERRLGGLAVIDDAEGGALEFADAALQEEGRLALGTEGELALSEERG